MSIQITIAEPQEGAKEVAHETRAVWTGRAQAWAAAASDVNQFQYTVSEDVEREVLDRVRCDWVQQRHAMYVEYTQNGWQCPTHNRNIMCYSFTWHWQDEQCIEGDTSGVLLYKLVKRFISESNRQLHEYKNNPQELRDLSIIDADWTHDTDALIEDTLPRDRTLEVQGRRFLKFVQEDELYLAGFFTEQDRRKMRFTSKRLGAYLASLGWDALDVREYVEQDRTRRATAQFKLYPNDVTWGDLYVNGTESCMSRLKEQYESKQFDVHPTDVYASAYFGKGDNGLALLVTEDVNGYVKGRVIVNRDGEFVRWYGDHSARRALVRAGLKEYSGAYSGAWLALIGDDLQFVHPYVDGDCSYGTIKGGRVYLSDSGDHELQDTEGVCITTESVWCYESNRRVPECAATYLVWQQEWVADDAVENHDVCYITDEPIISGTKFVYLAEEPDPDDYEEDEDMPAYVPGEEVTICQVVWGHMTGRGGRTIEGWSLIVLEDGTECILQC